MKTCPKCKRVYNDASLNFCLEDGEWLAEDSDAVENPTAILTPEISGDDVFTRKFGPATNAATDAQHTDFAEDNASRKNWLAIGGVSIMIFALIGVGAYLLYPRTSRAAIRSIAVSRSVACSRAVASVKCS